MLIGEPGDHHEVTEPKLQRIDFTKNASGEIDSLTPEGRELNNSDKIPHSLSNRDSASKKESPTNIQGKRISQCSNKSQKSKFLPSSGCLCVNPFNRRSHTLDHISRQLKRENSSPVVAGNSGSKKEKDKDKDTKEKSRYLDIIDNTPGFLGHGLSDRGKTLIKDIKDLKNEIKISMGSEIDMDDPSVRHLEKKVKQQLAKRYSLMEARRAKLSLKNSLDGKKAKSCKQQNKNGSGGINQETNENSGELPTLQDQNNALNDAKGDLTGVGVGVGIGIELEKGQCLSKESQIPDTVDRKPSLNRISYTKTKRDKDHSPQPISKKNSIVSRTSVNEKLFKRPSWAIKKKNDSRKEFNEMIKDHERRMLAENKIEGQDKTTSSHLRSKSQKIKASLDLAGQEENDGHVKPVDIRQSKSICVSSPRTTGKVGLTLCSSNIPNRKSVKSVKSHVKEDSTKNNSRQTHNHNHNHNHNQPTQNPQTCNQSQTSTQMDRNISGIGSEYSNFPLNKVIGEAYGLEIIEGSRMTSLRSDLGSTQTPNSHITESTLNSANFKKNHANSGNLLESVMGAVVNIDQQQQQLHQLVQGHVQQQKEKYEVKSIDLTMKMISPTKIVTNNTANTNTNIETMTNQSHATKQTSSSNNSNKTNTTTLMPRYNSSHQNSYQDTTTASANTTALLRDTSNNSQNLTTINTKDTEMMPERQAMPMNNREEIKYKSILKHKNSQSSSQNQHHGLESRTQDDQNQQSRNNSMNRQRKEKILLQAAALTHNNQDNSRTSNSNNPDFIREKSKVSIGLDQNGNVMEQSYSCDDLTALTPDSTQVSKQVAYKGEIISQNPNSQLGQNKTLGQASHFNSQKTRKSVKSQLSAQGTSVFQTTQGDTGIRGNQNQNQTQNTQNTQNDSSKISVERKYSNVMRRHANAFGSTGNSRRERNKSKDRGKTNNLLTANKDNLTNIKANINNNNNLNLNLINYNEVRTDYDINSINTDGSPLDGMTCFTINEQNQMQDRSELISTSLHVKGMIENVIKMPTSNSVKVSSSSVHNNGHNSDNNHPNQNSSVGGTCGDEMKSHHSKVSVETIRDNNQKENNNHDQLSIECHSVVSNYVKDQHLHACLNNQYNNSHGHNRNIVKSIPSSSGCSGSNKNNIDGCGSSNMRDTNPSFFTFDHSADFKSIDSGNNNNNNQNHHNNKMTAGKNGLIHLQSHSHKIQRDLGQLHGVGVGLALGHHRDQIHPRETLRMDATSPNSITHISPTHISPTQIQNIGSNIAQSKHPRNFFNQHVNAQCAAHVASAKHDMRDSYPQQQQQEEEKSVKTLDSTTIASSTLDTKSTRSNSVSINYSNSIDNRLGNNSFHNNFHSKIRPSLSLFGRVSGQNHQNHPNTQNHHHSSVKHTFSYNHCQETNGLRDRHNMPNFSNSLKINSVQNHHQQHQNQQYHSSISNRLSLPTSIKRKAPRHSVHGYGHETFDARDLELAKLSQEYHDFTRYSTSTTPVASVFRTCDEK